jgi:signal transduction histidine kinase
MAETFAAVLVNASLSVALFLAAPGSTATLSDLAIRIFFLFFVAIESGLLSRAARHHSRARQEVLQRLMRAEEDERRRLAGELHDRVGAFSSSSARSTAAERSTLHLKYRDDHAERHPRRLPG